MKKLLTLFPGLLVMANLAMAQAQSQDINATPPLSEKSVIVVHRAVPVPVETVSVEGWALEAKFAEPQEAHATQEGSPFGPAKVTKQSLADGQTIYSISRLTLPTAIQPNQAEAMFEAAKDNLLRRGRGSLKLEENVTLAGLPARRYVMEFTRESQFDDYRADCRLVLLDGSIYIVQFREPLNYYSSSDARLFFNTVRQTAR